MLSIGQLLLFPILFQTFFCWDPKWNLVFICKSLKRTNFYDMILFAIYSLFIFLVYAHTTVLSSVSLVCTKIPWAFSYYIIKYLCHFDVKFPEVAPMERHNKFGLYVYYLIYPWTLKTLDLLLSTQWYKALSVISISNHAHL